MRIFKIRCIAPRCTRYFYDIQWVGTPLTHAGEADRALGGSQLLPRRLLQIDLIDHRRELVAEVKRKMKNNECSVSFL